jgi:phosphatidylglycerol:prolipoprotein diacylglycerol transferase
MLFNHPLIGSYSFCLFFAILAGYLLSRYNAPRTGIKGSHIDNLTLLAATFGLFGARFFSWWFYYPPGRSFWKALFDSGGGMVFYGGMIFGIVMVLSYSLIARLPLGRLMDTFAPGMALGLACGRVGCFLAGCCWGDLCVAPNEIARLSPPALHWQVQTIPAISTPGFPLAVKFPPGAAAFEQHVKLGLIDAHASKSRPVHPVQLYEAFLALGLCVWLQRNIGRCRWAGSVVCQLVLGYAIIRFGTEFLRADNRPIYYGVTLSQGLSVLLAAIATGVLVGRKVLLRARVSTTTSEPAENLPAIQASNR